MWTRPRSHYSRLGGKGLTRTLTLTLALNLALALTLTLTLTLALTLALPQGAVVDFEDDMLRSAPPRTSRPPAPRPPPHHATARQGPACAPSAPASAGAALPPPPRALPPRALRLSPRQALSLAKPQHGQTWDAAEVALCTASTHALSLQAFVVAENPMSESGCGCGTSFDVKL